MIWTVLYKHPTPEGMDNKYYMIKKELTPKQNASRRLRIVDGHIKKIIEMIDNDTYCIDILQQTSAVKNAIKKTEEILLMNHMNSCVAKAVNSSGKEKAIEELAKVFRKLD